jgi:hypothetical protein
MTSIVHRFLLAFSLLGAIVASPASAEVYRPWCAQYYGAMAVALIAASSPMSSA